MTKQSLGAETIVYPTPVWIIGTYDEAGKPNGATVAWGGICSSKPPAVAISLRPARHTHAAIMARGAFTVNIPSEDHAKEADYFGLVSGKKEDKFAKSGLTPVRSELVDAPLIDEFPLALECKLLQTVDVGVHTQFIGEILDAKADESILNDDGQPDMAKGRSILFGPGTGMYHGIGPVLGKAYSIGREILTAD